MDMLINLIRFGILYAFHAISLCLLSGKKLTWLWILISVALEIISALIFIHVTAFAYAVALIYLLAISAYSTVFFALADGPLPKRIFIFMTYAICFILSAGLGMYISETFFSDNWIAMQINRILLSTLGIVFIRSSTLNRALELIGEIRKGWWYLAVFSTISILVSSIICIALFVDENNRLFIPFAAFSIVLFSSYVIIFRMIGFMAKENEINLINMQQRILEEELRAERDFVDEAKRIRHDIRHDNRIILEYLKSHQVDEAIAFLKEYDSGLDKSGYSRYCSNDIIDSLLRITARRCSNTGVSFTFSGDDIPPDIGLSKSDTVSIFGNLLENAVDAASKCDNGMISARILNKNGKLIMELRNSSCKNLEWRNGIPLTTKKDGGIGLRSASSIIQKHSGMIELSEADKAFSARVILPIQ